MINYLCTSPKPSFENTDALYNEIHLLQKEFKGSVTSLALNSIDSKLSYPILMYGMHKLRSIIKLDHTYKINHIYAPSIFHMPFLYFLRSPVVYSIFAGINPDNDIPGSRFMNKIDRFVVSNERDQQILLDKGLKNISLIRPTIDTNNFNKHDLELNDKVHLLMASAPWEIKQFESKGIHLLLKALKKLKYLHITFLWRNIFPEHMQKLIKEYEVEKQVSFINEFADVGAIHKKIHGAVLLTNDCTLVKAYPSSIAEAIVSGKPVIVSKDIPIAEFVEGNNCGIILEDFNIDSLIIKIKQFKESYSKLKNNSLHLDENLFTTAIFLKKYRSLYENLI